MWARHLRRRCRHCDLRFDRQRHVAKGDGGGRGGCHSNAHRWPRAPAPTAESRPDAAVVGGAAGPHVRGRASPTAWPGARACSVLHLRCTARHVEMAFATCASNGPRDPLSSAFRNLWRILGNLEFVLLYATPCNSKLPRIKSVGFWEGWNLHVTPDAFSICVVRRTP